MNTTRTHKTLIAAAATANLDDSGCGGKPDHKASDREKFEQAALKFAECMRRHGVNVPDPKPGSGGLILREGPAEAGSPALDAQADKACEKYLKQAPPPQISAKQESRLRDAALKHARCMRRHGIDMPDPTFEGDGKMTQRIGPGTDPSNPAVQRAEKACAKYAPGRIGAGPAPGPGA